MKKWNGYQKGINLGGWFSQCVYTEEHYDSFIKEEDIEEGMKVLEKSKGFIRSGLAKRLDTRRCPELIFALDESFKRED